MAKLQTMASFLSAPSMSGINQVSRRMVHARTSHYNASNATRHVVGPASCSGALLLFCFAVGDQILNLVADVTCYLTFMLGRRCSSLHV